ncbi:MAG: ATP-binding protein [Myxococcales bacterium]
MADLTSRDDAARNAPTVLNVNDDEVGLYTTSRVLRAAGFRVIEATTGAEALEHAQLLPDVALLDVRLPDLSGLEVARRLKSEARTRGIVIVYLSALPVDGESRAAMLAQWGDAHLRSPIAGAELVANIRALLRLRSEALEAIRQRDQFLAVAAHELRNPLNVVRLNLQLLDRMTRAAGSLSTDDIGRRLRPAMRYVDNLALLVDELLDVSRLANQRLLLEVQALDLAELLRDLRIRHEQEAQAAGTLIDIDLAGPVTLYGDRVRLEQVFANLVTNALKYGGGRPVTISLTADETSATVAVRDRGIGIAPADLPRIFDRFERVATAHRNESMGLGLYIARELVLAHGGRIDVDSRPGEGSTFTVTLQRWRLKEHRGAAASSGGGDAHGGEDPG